MTMRLEQVERVVGRARRAGLPVGQVLDGFNRDLIADDESPLSAREVSEAMAREREREREREAARAEASVSEGA